MKTKFRFAMILFAALLPGALLAADPALPRDFAGATPLQWSVRMADSQMTRLGDRLVWKEGGNAKWDYAAGLFTLSLLKLNERAPDPRYVPFAEAAIGSFIGPDGKIQGYKVADYNLDNLNPGKTILALYQITKGEKYRKAAELLRRQLDAQPRTSEGGFWHKQRYPQQMWLDGLFMGATFFAQYAQLFHEPASSLADVANQFRLVAAHTYDPASGLFYHGWDEARKQEWANPATGASSNFWGRAIGWYGMALVDVLDFFPADHPARPELIATLQKLCAGVLRHQDPASGIWYQVMDQGNRPGNYLEATASSMFVYTLAKGVNRGYLSRDVVPPLVKAYQGIVTRLVKTDSLGRVSLAQCCSVAGLGYGRNGSYDYYIKEPVVENNLKGVGPFILAGIQLQETLGLGTAAPRPQRARGGSGSASSAPLSGGGGGGLASAAAAPSSAPEWSQLPEILARIKAPVFPKREFLITKYGAAADGRRDSTAAIRRTIDACRRAGGGRVVVPPGQFLTGPIHLKSNVELHLEGGATLLFTTNFTAYLPAVFTRFEGMECYNYSPFIYAFEQENIAVTGEGLLDGQAGDDHWWEWAGKRQTKPGAPRQKAARDRLIKMVEQGAPVSKRRFGEGDYLRPSFIETYRCRNVLIEGVRIRRSPMWEIHPTLSTNVIVRGVDILSHGPNNDGCNPESCRDVLIEDCVFDTGDDCIAIKSGRNNDGRRVAVPSENIVIRRCTMKDGHGGVVIGSEVSGSCRNVFAEDCSMDSPNLDRVLRLKSNAVRGGVIENVFLRNIRVGRVADAVLQVDFVYEEGANGPHKPVARNLAMENLTVRETPRVLNVVGFPGAEISRVRLVNCTFQNVKKPDVVKEAEDVKLVGCSTTPAAAAGDGEAWQPLFNGQDLSGWVAMNGAVFVATNGCIHLLPSTGWLRTKRPYTNFVFEAEWRALEPNYNSGFFIRAGLDGAPFPTEVWQVNLKQTALGSLMKGGTTVDRRAAPPAPPNQWATFRIQAREGRLSLEVNGRRAWDFSQLDAPFGYLGLQAEGKSLDFRNLRVRELP